MKIRTDFVTNSSSSSFICSFCGNDVSGWDISLAEAEMYECNNGHTICETHFNIDDNKLCKLVIQNAVNDYREKVEKYPDDLDYIRSLKEEEDRLSKINLMTDDELSDYIDDNDLIDEYEIRYSLPEECCPICNFEIMTDTDMKNYMLKRHNMLEKHITQEVKGKFNNYGEFKNYLKK